MMWEESYAILGKAVERLREVCDKSREASTECNVQIYRDAAIQRFEFTVELFWKTLKRILEKEGIEAKTPKQVLRESYYVGLIDEEERWLGILDDRNKTSHTYDESEAERVFGRIQESLSFLEKEYKKVGKWGM